MNNWIGKLRECLERFFFESCDPRVVPILRIALGSLLIINTIIWWLDGPLWFTDAGVLTGATAQDLNWHERWSLFFSLPSTAGVIHVCLAILLVQSVLLTLGVASRFQAACIFVWLVSFHHRNPLICDGEDTVFRFLTFLMIFLPLDASWSLGRRLLGKPYCPPQAADVWALRLLQFEMALIYASATCSKFVGQTWQDGTALYYVSRMTDHFGRVPLPDWLFSMPWFVHGLTWSVLFIEGSLPIALWWRPTRMLALSLGIALHLGIEFTMHLFLFEWVMIVGLLSFLVLPAAQPRQK